MRRSSKVLALIRWISGLPLKEQWKSRFFDLKGAYDVSAFCSHCCLFSQNEHHLRLQDEGFTLWSVHCFLRVAHSLWAILVKEFAVARTNYFDYLVTFAKADEVASTTGSIKFVFKALGRVVAEDGDKAPDFSYGISAPGVQIN